MPKLTSISKLFKDATFSSITSSSNTSSRLPDLVFDMSDTSTQKSDDKKQENKKAITSSTDLEENSFIKHKNLRQREGVEGGHLVVPPFKPDICVYTDGACIHNGKPNAKAGMGVYFGKNDPRNLSKPVSGKQTNNTAELGAIWEAYQILANEITVDKKNILIYSDSIYAIRCCTTYGAKVIAMNKESEKTKQIPNYNLVVKMYNTFKNLKNVKFQHIKAHTGAKDIHSIGNDEADRLANEAIGVKPGTLERKKKTYINVPFNRKDEAKFAGAKWDVKKKKWYFEDSIPKDKQQLLLDNFGM